MQNEESPFARYRQGYIDGYEGDSKQWPDNDHYVRGYDAGEEDDALGAVNRYAEDLQPVSPLATAKMG